MQWPAQQSLAVVPYDCNTQRLNEIHVLAVSIMSCRWAVLARATAAARAVFDNVRAAFIAFTFLLYLVEPPPLSSHKRDPSV